MFTSPIIHLTLMMIFKFDLDYVETMCVVCGYCIAPYTCYFFSQATHQYLGFENLEKRGLLFGHQFAECVYGYAFCHQQLNRNSKIPGRHWGNSNTPAEVENYGDYCSSTQKIVYYNLSYHSFHQKKPQLKSCALKSI